MHGLPMNIFNKIKYKYRILAKRQPIIYDYSKKLARLLESKNKDDIYSFLKFFFKNYSPVKVLQIGANDGIMHDPLREFIVSYKNSQCFFVEPIPTFFRELVKNYKYLASDRKLKFLNVAVGDDDGNITLWKLKQEVAHKYYDFVQGMVSFKKEHFLRYINPENIDRDLESIVVPQRSIRSIVVEDCNQIIPDLVVIDVEGLERTIIENYPFDLGKPKSFIYESVHLSLHDQEVVHQKLTQNGYSIKTCSCDSIAILKT
jgi:FkbM family methyltransferase